MGMTDTSINDFNLKIRQTPWYQEWFAQRGLNPNRVKLNDQQRKELKALVEQQSGFQFPGDMKIDPAGNLNEKGGWAGLPTGVKIAIIAGATVATAGAAGAFGGAAGAASGAAGGSTAASSAAIPTLASTSLTSGMAAAAPTLAGTTAAVTGSTAAATAPSLMSRIAGFARNPNVLTGASRMMAGATQASAQNRGAEVDARLAHDELQLRADRERRDAETDAYRKSLFGQLAAGYQPSQRPTGAQGRNPNGFITDQARQSGQLMTDIARKRMETQDYPGITPFSELPVRPGRMERIGNYVAPALSLFDPRTYGR